MKCKKCGTDISESLDGMCFPCTHSVSLSEIREQKKPRFHIHMICPDCGKDTIIPQVEASSMPGTNPWAVCGECNGRFMVRNQFLSAAHSIWSEEDLSDKPYPFWTGGAAAYDMHLPAVNGRRNRNA